MVEVVHQLHITTLLVVLLHQTNLNLSNQLLIYHSLVQLLFVVSLLMHVSI